MSWREKNGIICFQQVILLQMLTGEADFLHSTPPSTGKLLLSADYIVWADGLLKGDYSSEAKRIQHWGLKNPLHHPQDTSSFPSEGMRHPSGAISIWHLIIPAEYKEWIPQRYVQPYCHLGKIRTESFAQSVIKTVRSSCSLTLAV